MPGRDWAKRWGCHPLRLTLPELFASSSALVRGFAPRARSVRFVACTSGLADSLDPDADLWTEATFPALESLELLVDEQLLGRALGEMRLPSLTDLFVPLVDFRGRPRKPLAGALTWHWQSGRSARLPALRSLRAHVASFDLTEAECELITELSLHCDRYFALTKVGVLKLAEERCRRRPRLRIKMPFQSALTMPTLWDCLASSPLPLACVDISDAFVFGLAAEPADEASLERLLQLLVARAVDTVVLPALSAHAAYPALAELARRKRFRRLTVAGSPRLYEMGGARDVSALLAVRAAGCEVVLEDSATVVLPCVAPAERAAWERSVLNSDQGELKGLDRRDLFAVLGGAQFDCGLCHTCEVGLGEVCSFSPSSRKHAALRRVFRCSCFPLHGGPVVPARFRCRASQRRRSCRWRF
jgi:hypothetical protein